MRSLLLISAVVIFAGIAAPKLVAQYVPRRAAEEAPRPADPRRVEIAAERDGHFYVDAEVNFRPVRFVVDTGATVIALRRSDAEAVGIRPVPADFKHPVSTANGAAYAAEAELDSLAVGAIEVGRLRALVLPDEQLSISLLGASFLNRLARYQVEGGMLVFEN